MPKEKVDQSFTIESDQKEWLNKMAQEYHLPDASKALRVLLDYAIEDGQPAEIFDTIRCRHCG